MEVLILTLFVSLVLAGAGVASFVWSVRSGAHEHGERLALLAVEDDLPPSGGAQESDGTRECHSTVEE